MNKEARLYLPDRLILPDFIYFPTKKIIEFDGSYYHQDTLENREKELKRDQVLVENGYNVFHVTEAQYKKNPEIELQKCIEFICGKN